MDRTQLIAEIERHWTTVERLLVDLAQPWLIYQILILAGLYLFAHLAARPIQARLDDWMHGLRRVNKRLLRILVAFVRHLRALIFVALVWLTVLVLEEIAGPSRSYVVSLVASLVTALAFVSIASLVIRNRLARKLVTWSAWLLVTIHLLGVMTEVQSLLDRIAIDIGEIRISLLVVVQIAVTLGVLILLASWSSALIKRHLEGSEDISPSMKVLMDKLFRFVAFLLAFVIAVQSVGFDLTTLAVFSGAVGLGLGFGLQKVVSNLVSGVILLMDKSIKPGDVISLGETFGWIAELGARYVAVVTRDGREYLIPNEDLITGQVVNWSHSSELIRLDIHFGVSYDSDPHQVRELAVEAARTVERVVGEPDPVCHLVEFGDSSLNFILRFWIRDPSRGLTNVRGAVFLALWDALKAADIEIPFPQRDVYVKKLPDRE